MDGTGYRAGLPHGRQLIQFNQLDSHDTARFLTLLQGNRARMQMAAVWLMSWIGVPCLYCMMKLAWMAPTIRSVKPFPWDESHWDRPLLALFQRMAALRKQSLALRRGGCQVLHAVGETLVFSKSLSTRTGVGGIAACWQRCSDVAVHAVLLAAGQWQRLEGKGEMEETQNAMVLQLGEESVTLWRRLG